MREIREIAAQAKKALDKIENGKTYTTRYVLNRLETAAANNSRDALICHMRDVMAKRATSHNFITQKEIAEIHDHLCGMSSGRSNFRKEAEDLLPSQHAVLKADSKDASSSRIPYEEKLSPLYEESDLSKELSGAFSLENKASFTALSDNSIKKAEKFAKVQLVSMGCIPHTVKAVRSNEHFVLCTASVDTSDFTQVNVSIPVQITNGLPSLPNYFIQDNKLVKLNKENVYVFIKDKNNFIKKTSANRFASQRSARDFQVDTPVVPASLEKYTDLENELIAAASSFDRNQIRVATGVVAAELSGFGVPNPQVRVASSTDKVLAFAADIPTSKGRVEINIPVDMPNGRPVIPNNFVVNGKTYRLNESGLKTIMKAADHKDDLNKISREALEMSRLSYNQLVDRIIDGVSRSDYRQAEDALNTIGDKFNGQQYLSALDKFTQLLKHSSSGTERDAMIKNALKNGDLIQVPTSVQPYCPKLGLPASKVDFDSKGRPIPIRRKAQRDNLDETGAMISSSRVALS
jgi:hypothetical protein